MKQDNSRWFVFFGALIMVALVNVDMTIVNLAVSSISNELEASVSQTQGIITSYLLGTAISFTILGKIADLVGRKKIYLLGVSLFAVGSWFIGYADSILSLMVWRFIQGIGFAGTLGLSFVIILEHFSPERHGSITGIAVTVSGFSQAIGPTLGGLVLSSMSWRWIFWLNIPFCLVSYLLIYCFANANGHKHRAIKLSISNIFYFVIGIGLVLHAMSLLSELSTFDIIIRLLLGFLLLFVFWYSSKSAKNPLVNVELFYQRDFLTLVTLRFLFMVLLSSSLFLIPLYLQNILGYSTTESGLILLCMTATVMITSPLTGKWIDLKGYKPPVRVSMILCCLASLLMSTWQAQGHIATLFFGLFILGLAVGIHTPSSINGINQSTPKDSAGQGIGIFFTMAMCGAISGVGISTLILLRLSHYYLVTVHKCTHITASLLAVSSGTRSISTLPAHLHDIASLAFMSSFHIIQLMLACLMLAAFLLSMTLKAASSCDLSRGNFYGSKYSNFKKSNAL